MTFQEMTDRVVAPADIQLKWASGKDWYTVTYVNYAVGHMEKFTGKTVQEALDELEKYLREHNRLKENK